MTGMRGVLQLTESHRQHLALAMVGEIPAEALPQHLRWHVVQELHARGWTDVEIAGHTRMTTYTTVRIRRDLGLEPNRVLSRFSPARWSA